MNQNTENTKGAVDTHIAPLHEDVKREAVSFKNRFGLSMAGELYIRTDANLSAQHPALVVGAPYGGVKEQGPCIYASELAQRGFVVLTYDQPYMGESEGEPRRVSSPELFTESFSAAVDFLGLQPYVNRERIGVIGICGSAGFALSAAQSDMRIKAVATASMYDMTAAARAGQSPEQIKKKKELLSQQRWTDAENGYPEYIPYFPEQPLNWFKHTKKLIAKGRYPPDRHERLLVSWKWQKSTDD
jgi:fermentation-respiration switch protein FrsA (DUF1100 family)